MKKIRYAVVGLGNISQGALIPGFRNAPNSVMTALVSGEADKREKLAKRYGVSHTYSYDQYDQCLKSGEVDAVYIGLPNHLHCEYTVRAAAAGVHVLCEKPMAVNETECKRMIAACEKAKVKLMIAYRLHFEEGNLDAMRTAESGKLGDLRIFHSTFSQQVRDQNVRTAHSETEGGGSLFDVGVYCINAARYMLRDEPTEALAINASSPADPRFNKTPEMTSAILRFPGERLALITSSFGAAPFSEFCVIGAKGWLRVSPAYDYKQPVISEVVIAGKSKKKQYRLSDQFGSQLTYFSDCILENREPEPNGVEGLADVRVVRAIMESARTNKPVKLAPFEKADRPTMSQLFRKPVVKETKLVDAPPPTR